MTTIVSTSSPRGAAEERLAKAGVTLPPPQPAIGNYRPVRIVAGWLFTSGQLSWRDGASRAARRRQSPRSTSWRRSRLPARATWTGSPIASGSPASWPARPIFTTIRRYWTRSLLISSPLSETRSACMRALPMAHRRCPSTRRSRSRASSSCRPDMIPAGTGVTPSMSTPPCAARRTPPPSPRRASPSRRRQWSGRSCRAAPRT